MPSFMLLSQFAQSTYFFDLTALTMEDRIQDLESKLSVYEAHMQDLEVKLMIMSSTVAVLV